MGTTQAEVSKDSPLWLAWIKYTNTEEYANIKYWATKQVGTEGALWAAFADGYAAGQAELKKVINVAEVGGLCGPD